LLRHVDQPERVTVRISIRRKEKPYITQRLLPKRNRNGPHPFELRTRVNRAGDGPNTAQALRQNKSVEAIKYLIERVSGLEFWNCVEEQRPCAFVCVFPASSYRRRIHDRSDAEIGIRDDEPDVGEEHSERFVTPIPSAKASNKGKEASRVRNGKIRRPILPTSAMGSNFPPAKIAEHLRDLLIRRQERRFPVGDPLLRRAFHGPPSCAARS